MCSAVGVHQQVALPVSRQNSRCVACAHPPGTNVYMPAAGVIVTGLMKVLARARPSLSKCCYVIYVGTGFTFQLYSYYVFLCLKSVIVTLNIFSRCVVLFAELRQVKLLIITAPCLFHQK